MGRTLQALPGFIVMLAGIAMIVHGPIPQLAHYHDFADQRTVLGIPNGWDVLSNAGFAAVGLWALARSRAFGDRPEAAARDVFFATLLLTAVGSTWYHLAPDNARLLFDRLPIALACAALLAAAHARIHHGRIPGLLPVLLATGVASVLWWSWSESLGRGDLRPYLLLQGAPLILIPLWQWNHREPRAERLLFGGAVVLYAAAKALELADAAVLSATGFVSGHTLKHLLAAVAAILIGRMFLRPHA